MTDEVIEPTPAEDSIGATEAPEAVDTDIEGTDQSAATEEGEQDLPEEFVYDIDGEEVSLDTIKEWKAGTMKNADYTQKTQALAADRKALTEKSDAFEEKLQMLTDMESEIESLVMGDLGKVDLNALLDDGDTAEYLKAKEQMDTRKSKLSALMEKRSELIRKQDAENAKQLHDSLGWSDATKKDADVKALNAYAKEIGLSQAEFNKIRSPKIIEALIDGAKYRKLTTDKPATTKKVRQAPKTPKPSASTPKTNLKPYEMMYGPDD